jgi:hypothetical protein
VVGAGPVVHQPGQLASNSFFELSVHGVKTCSVEPHLQPPAGVKRLGVEVTITARSDVQVPANPFYALVLTPQGNRFEATLAGCQPVLTATRLGNGDSARGWISFDLPESLSQARFSYAPALLGAGKPELVFAIEP